MKKEKRVMRRKIIESKHEMSTSCLEEVSDAEISGVPSSDNDDDDDDVAFHFTEMIETSSDEGSPRQNRNKYPELCKAIDRCKVSNRDACIIANAVLKDLDLLTPQTTVDPAKIQRQRKYWRKQESEKRAEQHINLRCIGFDGKQDTTLVQKGHKRVTAKQEHYVVVSFPGNIYIDHVVPDTLRLRVHFVFLIRIALLLTFLLITTT